MALLERASCFFNFLEGFCLCSLRALFFVEIWDSLGLFFFLYVSQFQTIEFTFLLWSETWRHYLLKFAKMLLIDILKNYAFLSYIVLQVWWKSLIYSLHMFWLILRYLLLLISCFGFELYHRLAKSSIKLVSRIVKFMHLASYVKCALELCISQKWRSYCCHCWTTSTIFFFLFHFYLQWSNAIVLCQRLFSLFPKRKKFKLFQEYIVFEQLDLFEMKCVSNSPTIVALFS